MLLEPRSSQPEAHPRDLAVPPGRRRRLLPALVVLGSLALAALSLLGPSTPTYDPWAWIIWGREVAQLDLVTTYGPSWKPLPVLFTALFSLFGDAAPELWLLVARAGALVAVALAFLLARRLGGIAAGVAAAAGLAVMPWWLRNAVSGNSEGLLVACVLAAVLAHASGRRGWALALGVGAGLLRPEAWPFLGLYALWLVVEDRRRLPWVAGALATLPLLWLGPELWGSGNALRASDRAQQPNANSAAFADSPAVAVLRDTADMLPAFALAGIALAVPALALGRVPPGTRALGFGLAALTGAWVALVALMTEAGFSGNQRYLVLPAALAIVLGATGLVWAVRAALLAAGRRPGAAGTALVAVLVAMALALPGVARLGAVGDSIAYQAQLTDDLDALVERHGADRLLACGRPVTGRFLVPAVAWHLGTHLRQVGFRPPADGAVLFHVRTTRRSALEPRPGRPADARVLDRRGGWRLAVDCREGA